MAGGRFEMNENNGFQIIQRLSLISTTIIKKALLIDIKLNTSYVDILYFKSISWFHKFWVESGSKTA